MKSPAILFSIPLLVTVLAAQSRGQTVDASAAASPAATDCCPARKKASEPRLRVDSGEAETLHLKIRGQRRPVDVMTNQVFVRSRDGKERVHRFSGSRGVAGASREAVRLKELSRGADKVNLVAYPSDRPRTEDNMFLLSARVSVRLMEGVDAKAFYATTGAVKAKLMDYAPDAMVLYYPSATEAMEAAERLSAMPGVVSASQVIAVKRMPEYLPNEQYFRPSGPSYNPSPQTDNLNNHSCPANLCDIVPTSAYAWWANNRAGLVGPVNSVVARVDLGDFPPVGYNPLFPKLQGEQADIRLPLAWENMVNTLNRVSGFNQKIMIIDDGVVSAHPDLATALGAPRAVDLFNSHHKNMYTGANSPEPDDPANDAHGTALAGIVAARLNSTDTVGGAGIVGVAPKSTIQVVVGIKRFIDDVEWAEAFAYGTTQTDEDNDGNIWEHKRKGAVDFDICLNASSEQGSASATRLFPEDYLWHQAITFGATEQRNRLGVVYITSAGNGAGGGGSGHMDVNYMEQKNSIYQIPVGGVSELGRRIGRSNSGAALICVAPTWGDELPPVFNWSSKPPGWPAAGHLTAPLPLSSDPPLPIFKNPPVGPDDMPTNWRRTTQGITTLGPTSTNGATGIKTYTHTFDFTGTSASAAQVAGIVALMLETNPNLNYRDIKEILMRSSRVVNDVRVNTLGAAGPVANPAALWPTQWRVSGLGHPLNHAFGAGLIDADRAIKIAKKWTTLGVGSPPIVPVNFDPAKPAYAKTITDRDRFTGGIYIPKPSSELIPTDGRWLEVIVPPPLAGMRIEQIEVRVRLYHRRRGDLEIKLVAPQQANWDPNMIEPMESVLFAPHRDDQTTSYFDGPPPAGQTTNPLNTPTDWTFSTVRHWGSYAGAGTWKLLIRDAVQAGTSNGPVGVTVSDKDATDSSFVSRQKLDGIAMTYHGSNSSSDIHDPPRISSKQLRLTTGTTPRIEVLKATTGSGGVGGAAPFPVISWDMYDSSEVCPIQPSNPTHAPFEFFPPGWRLQGDTSATPELVPLTTVANNRPLPPIPPEWPQRQHPATWISFFDPPPPNDPPLEVPPPLTAQSEGAQGALSLRPPWVTDARLTLNRNHIIFRDAKNKNDATNFIYARLNRLTGGLEIIPVNKGTYSISVYAENLLGLSKVQPLEITVTASLTYGEWASLFWAGDDLGDPCTSPVSGYSADPDGDGLQNALEYSMRLNPTVADEGVWPPYTVEGNEVIFNWPHDLATPDMIQTGEISQDLINWTPVVPTVRSVNNNLEQLQYRMPFTPETRNFFRLKAQPAAPCP